MTDYTAILSNGKDPLSTWFIYQGKKPKNALGKSNYRKREGVNFGLKTAFYGFELLIDKGNFVQIRNQDGKIKDIEKTKIYPMIMSRHIKKWKLEDSRDQKYTYCILPQSKPAEDNEKKLKKECPKTWEWLNDFRDDLLARKSKSFAKHPFYSIFGLGDWDSKYKVVWKSMGFSPQFVVVSSTEDDVLGKKLVLAEHVLYFIPSNREKEAHYICAVLNSSLIKKNLTGLSSKGKSGLSGSIVGKIKLDKFNPKNSIHQKLARLSKRAHHLAEKNQSLDEVKIQIDRLVEELYTCN